MTKLRKIDKNKPVCLGTGLVALDVILNGTPATPAKLCVGGSCGNILSILSFLGWTSKPIARLSKGNATKNVLKDLTNFDVKTELISRENDGSTQIIIHRILKDKNGNAKHRFEFKVPGTKEWLPSYKPLLGTAVENITKKQANAQVFYFDRVSRSSIDLAKFYKEKGALIIFEPSSYKEEKQFSECLVLADIIKFSSDRISNYSEFHSSPIAPLEIETLGKEGLRYRLKSNKNKAWKKITPFELPNIIDTAGAGDWCTAGIINELGYNGAKSFKDATLADIESALNMGQALGAINCIYDGARGIMYNMTYAELNNLVSNLFSKKKFSEITNHSDVKIITIKNFDFESLLS
jgi:sugar/nucleoside kinase (ribokinase family)